MSRPAVVEVWPREAILYVPTLPGLQINAASPDDALRQAPGRLLAFTEWLTDLDLLPAPTEGPDIEVVETLPAVGDAGPLFALDERTPDQAAVELALAVGRGEVSDILELVFDLSEDGMREAARTLAHLAELDRWYARRLAEVLSLSTTVSDPIDDLVAAASSFEEAVDVFVEVAPADVWEIDGERWSLAKVLRRRTGHLREHLPELIAIDQA